MKIIKYPSRSDWEEIVKRPHLDVSQLNTVVERVLKDVRDNGDEAVKRYEEKFDHAALTSIAVTEEEIMVAMKEVSKELLDSLTLAHSNITKFHKAQKFNDISVNTCNGVHCYQKSIAIQKVGLYIPGGTAPLFSTVLMLATPAKIAGCSEIILCTP
nr:histidinol dehydrogenase [Prevotella sp.]